MERSQPDAAAPPTDEVAVASAAEPQTTSADAALPRERPRPAQAGNEVVSEIELYELDGIPLAYLPMPGPTILMLAFRVGRADEPVIHGGMSHLTEHLVLTSVTDALSHSNGSTEPFRVTFTRRGTPAETARFLREVCERIEKPSLARMHQEANVLRTEAMSRSGSMPLALRLLWYRTGYQGIGAVHLPELFLRSPDERTLRAWIEDKFVAGNAAIWIAGELPDDLYVSLPPGPRQPPPVVQTIADFETPTLVFDQVAGVGASFVVERSVAMATAIRFLDRQLKKRLRVDRGLGYEVGHEYIPVSGDVALLAVWATCLPNDVRDVQRVFLDTMDELSTRGMTDEEVDEQYRELTRAYLDPMSVPTRLDAHVMDTLLGHQQRSAAELIDEQWRIRPDDVASAFQKARESMLLMLPTGTPVPQRPFKPYPPPPSASLGEAHVFDAILSKENRGWGKPKPARLIVGREGVAIHGGDGKRRAAAMWADCVAVVHDPRMRSLVSSDGTIIYVIADEWREGGHAVKLVDRFAPRGLIVPAAS